MLKNKLKTSLLDNRKKITKRLDKKLNTDTKTTLKKVNEDHIFYNTDYSQRWKVEKFPKNKCITQNRLKSAMRGKVKTLYIVYPLIQ